MNAEQDLLSFVPPELFHLLPGFLARRESEIGELTEFLRLRQFTAIESTGHKMKGTGLGYGFQVVSDLGRELERAAANEDVATIQVVIAKLARFSRELKAHISTDSRM